MLCVHVAHQAPRPMGLSRQEYRSGLPFPPIGDLPNPGIKPRSPSLQADSLPSEPPGKHMNYMVLCENKYEEKRVVDDSDFLMD